MITKLGYCQAELLANPGLALKPKQSYVTVNNCLSSWITSPNKLTARIRESGRIYLPGFNSVVKKMISQQRNTAENCIGK